MTRSRPILPALVAALLALAASAAASPGEFTYQGKLQASGAAYTGSADIRYILYGAPAGGAAIVGFSHSNAQVTDGLFTTQLDFAGGLPPGDAWLELSVRTPAGAGAFTTISPRQKLTGAPSATWSSKPWTFTPETASVTLEGVPSPVDVVMGPGRVGVNTWPFFPLDVMAFDASTIARFSGGSTTQIVLDAESFNDTGVAVRGLTLGTGGVGVLGASSTSGATGVLGSLTSSGHAVSGVLNGANGVALFGQCSQPASSFAGFFQGRTSATGTKSFIIDHPLDPANKTLTHYCAEGPEPLNVYQGTVVTDDAGAATISLPDYFDALNVDARYQLTVIDGSDEFVLAKITREIEDNRFTLRTSAPHVKVCWQVSAVRHDAFVRAYGAPVEADKPDDQRGAYLAPELYHGPAMYQAPDVSTNPVPAPRRVR